MPNPPGLAVLRPASSNPGRDPRRHHLLAAVSSCAYPLVSFDCWLGAMAEEDVDWTQMFDRVKGSIFFILFAPKQDQLEELKILADEVKTIRNKKLRHDKEETIQEARLVNAVRKYGTARVAGVDSTEDTIILSVENNSLKNYSDDGICAQAHPALEISADTPINRTQCMMVSWPSYMPRMVSMGTTVSSRGIGLRDPLGYNMTVLEVDMRTEDSSSGAPLFNSNGEVIGILQGRLNRTRSIFVAGSHLHGWVQAAHGA